MAATIGRHHGVLQAPVPCMPATWSWSVLLPSFSLLPAPTVCTAAATVSLVHIRLPPGLTSCRSSCVVHLLAVLDLALDVHDLIRHSDPFSERGKGGGGGGVWGVDPIFPFLIHVGMM